MEFYAVLQWCANRAKSDDFKWIVNPKDGDFLQNGLFKFLSQLTDDKLLFDTFCSKPTWLHCREKTIIKNDYLYPPSANEKVP